MFDTKDAIYKKGLVGIKAALSMYYDTQRGRTASCDQEMYSFLSLLTSVSTGIGLIPRGL